MHRNVILSAAIAGFALIATPAHAENVTFSGFADGYKSVNYKLSAPNVAKQGSANAGGFDTSVNGGPSFVSYCVDLYQTIGFNASYSGYTEVLGSAFSFANTNANNDLAKLFSAGHVVNSAKTSAAFQIAVWEIAYETSGLYNLGNGAAKFWGGGASSSGALTLASGWLANLASITDVDVGIHVLESSRRQDMVYAAPVPEPSTYALMLAGLAGVGLVARRRRAAQRV